MKDLEEARRRVERVRTSNVGSHGAGRHRLGPRRRRRLLLPSCASLTALCELPAAAAAAAAAVRGIIDRGRGLWLGVFLFEVRCFSVEARAHQGLARGTLEFKV